MTESLPAQIPDSIELKQLVSEPEYVDTEGNVRSPTFIEQSVQALIESKKGRILRGAYDPEMSEDLERVDASSSNGISHVEVNRFTNPNGTLSRITFSGYFVTGNVSNDLIQSGPLGELKRIRRGDLEIGESDVVNLRPSEIKIVKAAIADLAGIEKPSTLNRVREKISSLFPYLNNKK